MSMSLHFILAERARALKAKERFARTASGFGSDGSIDGPSQDRATPVWPESDRRSYDMEFVRPQTVGEEELQLQLAIAMSKEEADQEDQKRRSDDVRLQLALSQSEHDFKSGGDDEKEKKTENNLVDLLDAFGSTDLASGGVAAASSSIDPWGMPTKSNQPTKTNDLWSSPKPVDPWLPPPPSTSSAAARTISPAAGNSSAIEGWLQTSPPAGGVPVLPAKPTLSTSNDLDGAWSIKPPSSHADPWNSKPHTTQVPSDPWNANATAKPPQADPWNLTNNTNGASAGVSLSL
jgi:epsin